MSCEKSTSDHQFGKRFLFIMFILYSVFFFNLTQNIVTSESTVNFVAFAFFLWNLS